jgi:hypothetical protein
VKRGEAGALQALGFGEPPQVSLSQVQLNPRQARIGGKIGIGLRLHNHTSNTQALMVDLRIGYIKANGAASPKVFKLKALQLAPGASAELQKQISLADMTTRKHYPGQHQVEVLLNGQPMPLGSFQLMP